MTVIRLGNSGLLVHSPTRADAATKAALAELGPVDSIMAPTWWHDLFLGEWVAAYPAAKLYGEKDLIAYHRRLPFQPPLNDRPSPWPEIDLLPVDGMWLFLNEIVTLHKPSRTAIIADLAFYLSETRPASIKRWFRFVGGYPGCRFPVIYRPAVRNRAQLRKEIERVLAWDFDRLILGHGDVIETEGKTALRHAFAWLLG